MYHQLLVFSTDEIVIPHLNGPRTCHKKQIAHASAWLLCLVLQLFVRGKVLDRLDSYVLIIWINVVQLGNRFFGKLNVRRWILKRFFWLQWHLNVEGNILKPGSSTYTELE